MHSEAYWPKKVAPLQGSSRGDEEEREVPLTTITDTPTGPPLRDTFDESIQNSPVGPGNEGYKSLAGTPAAHGHK